MNNLKHYDHIIWDWNGTLLDDVTLCVNIINNTLEIRGLSPITISHYKQVFTFPIINYYKALGFDFLKESFEVIGTEFIISYERQRHTCDLMPDAIPTLQHIADLGISQSILSASKQEYLDKALKEYQIDRFLIAANGLDNHYASSKVDIGKAFIEKHQIDPSKTLMIGDTTHDADVADAMGVDCCLIPNGHQNRETLASRQKPMISSLSDLMS